LVDRADRARAQAIANCQSLERAMNRTRAYVPGFDSAHRSAGRGDAEARLRELEETVDGLTNRLESQGPIEQAKGIIMAQAHCDEAHAFDLLRQASQARNVPVRALAAQLIAKATEPPPTGKTARPRRSSRRPSLSPSSSQAPDPREWPPGRWSA
jgi:cell division septation protein DedD